MTTLSWDEIEGGLEDSTSVEVEQGIERMLNNIRIIDLGGRLNELANESQSWAMYWLVVSARSELEKGNLSECMAWLYQAKQMAWYKLSIWDKLKQCIDLFYKIEQDVWPYYYWERLPVVEEKARILASVMPLIRPDVEEAAKRTRQISLRYFLGESFFRSSPITQLDHLLCAEFIAAHFSTREVRMLVQHSLLEVLGGMYEYSR